MVGVSFLGETVVYAQQISDNGVPVIEMVGSTALSDSWDIGTIGQPEFRQEMEPVFETIKNDLHFPDRHISLVLPFEWLHFYSVSVDKSLSSADQREFLRWEFQQRFGDQSKVFRPQFYPLASSEDFQQIITVALPEDLLPIVKNAADKVHLDVSAVELSPFSALTNIPDGQTTGCVCKFTPGMVEVSSFEHHAFVSSALFTIDENNVLRLKRSSGAESETKELRAVASSLFSQEVGGVAVFIYGTAVPDSIQSLAENTESLQYIRPFEDIRVNFRHSDGPDVLEESRYAEVAGTIRQSLGDTA